jgi:hypothetical protein
MNVYVYWETLIKLARAEASARLSGDVDALAVAAAKHENYRQACLNPNAKMVLPRVR